jgi:hypothetical protein
VGPAPTSGDWQILAVYSGDSNYAASWTSLGENVINAMLTVTANDQTMTAGQPVPTLTYTITGFVNGDTQGTATAGQPDLSTTATSSSPPGTYPITITAGSLTSTTGDYSFAYVNGTLTVTAASTGSFRMSAGGGGGASQTVHAGETATYTISITPQGGFTGPVTLSCTGLPVDARYSFTPTTLTLAAGTTAQTTLTIATTDRDASGIGSLAPKSGLGNWALRRHDAGGRPGNFGPSARASLRSVVFSVWAFVLVAGFAPLRKRLRRKTIAVLLGLALICLVLGLGSCATQQRTYTVTVNAVSNAAPAITESTTVTLTVQ